jgi:hypothetical protein
MRSDDVTRLIVWACKRARAMDVVARSGAPIGFRADLFGADAIAKAAGVSRGRVGVWAHQDGAPVYGGPRCLVSSRAALFDWLLDRAHHGELRVTKAAGPDTLVALAARAAQE